MKALEIIDTKQLLSSVHLVTPQQTKQKILLPCRGGRI